MRTYLLAAACLFVTFLSQAQIPPTGGPAQSVPIDGGASLLAAGGVAYAVRRLRQRRRA